jgi:hypothetical protein
MRTAIIALSLTTVAFAASTAYLARELRHERANAAMRPTITTSSATVAAATQIPTPAVPLSGTPEHQPSPATPGVASIEPSIPADLEAQLKSDQQATYRQLVERFDDPDQRAEMLAEFKAMVRSSNPGLAQALNLSKDDAERMIALLALQQAENQARYARCYLDSPCEVEKMDRYGPDTATQEIANLLGPEGQQKYAQYQTSVAEREAVAQFRTRLGDATHLRDENAEALIDVLADERQRISEEASQRGTGLTGIGNGVGMVWVSEAGASADARYESARENSRRLRARAAEVLTPAQMRAFDEMQDELLLSTRQQLRKMQETRTVTNAPTQ